MTEPPPCVEETERMIAICTELRKLGADVFEVRWCKLDPSLKATWFQPLNMKVHSVLPT